MSAPLILAMPSKGRLQQNGESFFARSGLELVKPRGPRDYRGASQRHPGRKLGRARHSPPIPQAAAGAEEGVRGPGGVAEVTRRAAAARSETAFEP